MGIIKAAVTAVGTGFADQWLEVIEPGDMGERTVFTRGVQVRKGSNTKKTVGTVSDGSVIHVYPNQFMMVVDGGEVVDYTAEEGYYTVKASSLPSLFNGQLKDTIRESFNRIRYGGMAPGNQKALYVNLQEIKGIKFGTRNAINYYDNFYNAELFLRAHGTYSIKVTDPLRFYAEVVPRNAMDLEIDDVNEQYLSEFLEALQSSINQMSADGVRISFVSSKGRELGRYMADTLDEDWRRMRGMEIQSVGIASISYDEESQKLINIRNEGAMMGDPVVREGYVQKSIAEGLKSAGANPNGAIAGFMGMGAGTQAGKGFMEAASAANMQQMQMNLNRMEPPQGGQPQRGQYQAQASGGQPQGKQCQGQPQGKQFHVQPRGSQFQAQPQLAAAGWTCRCGSVNLGNFCGNCGSPRPVAQGPWTCSCGAVNNGRFCGNCGKPRV